MRGRPSKHGCKPRDVWEKNLKNNPMQRRKNSPMQRSPGKGVGVMRKRSGTEPDAYVLALTGWRRACVETLRAAVRKAADLEEAVKWGHLVYAANGPVLLIRAEDELRPPARLPHRREIFIA